MSFGIYLPSVFTVFNLGCGLYSIISSSQGKFTLAAWFIIIGIIFDGLDGLIARLTKSTSLLGVELDSFADFVSFCVAPMILMYHIALIPYGIPGLAVGFLYVLFGTIRLAKYNIKSFEIKTYITYFEGLPTTAAGGILASFVLVFQLLQKSNEGITVKTIPILMKQIPVLFSMLPVMIVLLSLLMLTEFHYASFTKLRFWKRFTLRTFLLLIVGILLVVSYPESIIFVMFFCYIFSGLIEYAIRIYSLRRGKQKKT